jgi:hypothetical protein
MTSAGGSLLKRPSWNQARLALAGAAAIGLTVWAKRHEPFGQALLWSAWMLLSFVGWGSLVNRWLSPGRRVDWGLRAGWGMALSILSGGFLCLGHIAFRSVLIGQVTIGIALFLYLDVLRRRRRISATRLRRGFVVWVGNAGVLALIVAAYAALAYLALGYLGDHYFNQSDDPPLYMALPEKLVQTGIFLEPFAARRIPVLGGHVYLHALFFSVALPYYVHVVDGGVCETVVVGLLVGQVRRSGLKKWQLVSLALVLLLFFSLRTVRRNTGSLFSGVAAIITLYRTVRTPMGGEGYTRDTPQWPTAARRVACLAALSVVPIVLRPSNAVAVVPFIAIVLASDFVMANRRPWSREALTSLLRVGLLFAGVFVLSLLPWSVLLRQSSGTFFYPIGHDNTSPGFSFFSESTHLAKDAFILVSHGRPLATLVPFAIAGLAPLRGRRRNDLVALTLGACFAMFMLARQAGFFGPDDTCRWYFTFVAAQALVVAASVGSDWGRATLVVTALAAHLAIAHDDVLRYVDDRITLREAVKQDQQETTARNTWSALTSDYVDVQSHIPVGATVAVAVSESFRFDFARNRIYLLDLLGAMGPKPGWPLHQGPEALANYLRGAGVDYVVYVNFNLPGELYNRNSWQSALKLTNSYLTEFARIQLDAEDAIEGLPKIRRPVYEKHGMTVVDLTASPR